MKSKYEFRIDCNKNVLFVHDMSLLSILHDTGLLNALEGKCTIGDTLIIFLGERPFLRVVRMFRNWPLTLTSLTNPKPPAPRALTIWRSSKPAFSIWAFIIFVGRSGSWNTAVKSPSQSWQIVKLKMSSWHNLPQSFRVGWHLEYYQKLGKSTDCGQVNLILTKW